MRWNGIRLPYAHYFENAIALRSDEMCVELFKRVEDIVLEDLNKRFTGALVFSPILVDTYITDDGFKYLDISIVFDGDQKLLDPEWYASFIPRIWLKLEEADIEGFPSTSLIEKSEWQSYNRRRKVAAQ